MSRTVGILTVSFLLAVMVAVTGNPLSKGQNALAFRWADKIQWREKIKNVREAVHLPFAPQRRLTPTPPTFVVIAASEVPQNGDPSVFDLPLRPQGFSAPLRQHQIEVAPIPAPQAAMVRPLTPVAQEADIISETIAELEPLPAAKRVSERMEPTRVEPAVEANASEAEPLTEPALTALPLEVESAIQWAAQVSENAVREEVTLIPGDAVPTEREPAQLVQAAEPAQPTEPVDPKILFMIARLDAVEPVPAAPSMIEIPEGAFAETAEPTAAIAAQTAPAKTRRAYVPTKSEQPISVARMIHNAIQSDKSLSEAVKLTIRVSSYKGSIILKGLVLDERSILYVEKKARKIAGWSTRIDNRLIAMS